MATTKPDANPKPPHKLTGFIKPIIVVAVIILIIELVSGRLGQQPPPPLPEVRNSCAACGTATLVGRWVSTDGRMIDLSPGQTYALSDGQGGDLSGTWRIDGDKLCLTDSIGGNGRCIPYEQAVDALRLGDGLYERN